MPISAKELREAFEGGTEIFDRMSPDEQRAWHDQTNPPKRNPNDWMFTNIQMEEAARRREDQESARRSDFGKSSEKPTRKK